MTRRLLNAAVLVVMAVGLGCGAGADGPPHIEEDRSACAHCGMLVSERTFAAAYRAPGQEPRVFDDIACLRAAARREGNLQALTSWFHDAESREWIDGRRATFVYSEQLKTPMSGGMIAFADAGAAARRASALEGRVIASLDEMLAGKERER
ncbi:MAG: nitrous oxide reductase accessory protein NosL [Acidobacteriota bacterium]|nr:nitrous oxide reductase accessory protein NosL [Acidobacteriota bacterium]